jgi:hypothetical protein
VEILRNAIEYIESLEEMLHGQGKLNKNLTPGALAAAAAAVGSGAAGGVSSSTVNASASAEFLVSHPSFSQPLLSIIVRTFCGSPLLTTDRQ